MEEKKQLLPLVVVEKLLQEMGGGRWADAAGKEKSILFLLAKRKASSNEVKSVDLAAAAASITKKERSRI